MDDNGDSPRYLLDISKDAGRRRSLSFLIASRRCYQAQQGQDDAEIIAEEPKRLIRQIASHCSGAADYLLPDTPLKESILRTLLAANNRPMSAEDISKSLSERWAMTAQARDVSPAVIRRLLDSSPLYAVRRS